MYSCQWATCITYLTHSAKCSLLEKEAWMMSNYQNGIMYLAYCIPADEQGTNQNVSTIAGINLSINRPFVQWHKPIHDCTVVNLSTVLLRDAQWGPLRMGQCWPWWGGQQWASHSLFTNAIASTSFSEVSHTGKTFAFLVASLLKVKKLKSSAISLFYDIRRMAVTFVNRTTVSWQQPVF